jgi:hypothetical protein
MVARSHRILLESVMPVLALLVAAGRLPAQSRQAGQEWGFQNVRAAWCVHYLMDREEADKAMPRQFRPVAASEFPGLSPALSNLIKGEPEYAGWVPAEFCAYHFDQATIGDQTLGEAGDASGGSQFLGAWLIGAQLSSVPSVPEKPTYFVATLRTPNWRFIRLAETSFITMDYAVPSLGKVPESTDDRYRVTMGRTIITWDGHLAGDSATASSPTEQVWWALSSRGAPMHGQVKIQTEKGQAAVGTLQIAGNDALAKSLRASPIRMVGPISWGGSGTFTFAR